MWYYAVAFLALAAIAEALGLGGVPVRSLQFANTLFTVLLLGYIILEYTRFIRR
jgi:uncharacterized membrane protein YtjA (UPF0391 family)